MSSSLTQPIPKAPKERTLLVAVSILIAVAVIQLVAAAVALVPRLDLEKMARSMSSRSSTQVATAPTSIPTVATQVSAEDSAKVTELLAEAEKFRSTGNFIGALQAVSEADRLAPNKASILFQMAGDSDQLGKTDDTIALLRRIATLPASTEQADMAAQAQARAALAQIPGGHAQGETAPAPAATPASDKESRMVNDIGIPIGSVMGIVNVRLTDGEPGTKNLSVATKGASGEKIDPMKFQATVDFYEQDDQGQILHNDSSRPTEWLSGPAIDWADANPEIFQVKYRLPLADRGDLPPLQYYGYVVAIYYNGELQDQRADPPALLNQFAPPLHKGGDSE